MKRETTMTRRLVRGLALSFLVAGAVGGTGAAAAAARPAPATVGHTKAAAGNYEIHSSNGGTGQITVLVDSSWLSDYGDSGILVALGTSAAFVVTKSTDGDLGCIFLGTVGAKGINSAHKQGPQDCGSFSDTWYATRDKVMKAAPSSSPWAPDHGPAPASGAGPSPVGAYELLDMTEATRYPLALNADGSSLLDGTLGGHWVLLGKSVAFSFSAFDGQGTCVAVGTLIGSGIDTQAKPGLLQCEGQLQQWDATRD